MSFPWPKISFLDGSPGKKEGEIVGLAGLVGSGRTELARVIFGVDSIDSGEIRIFGNREIIDSPMKATRLGLAFLTEDRKGLGLFSTLSVKENIVAAAMRQLFPKGKEENREICF